MVLRQPLYFHFLVFFCNIFATILFFQSQKSLKRYHQEILMVVPKIHHKKYISHLERNNIRISYVTYLKMVKKYLSAPRKNHFQFSPLIRHMRWPNNTLKKFPFHFVQIPLECQSTAIC